MNTDLSKFRFAQEGYAVYAVEGDLADFGVNGMSFIAPVAFVILDDGTRRWVLKRGFSPIVVMDEDGLTAEVTAWERAERMVRRIHQKGKVDLTLWNTWDNVFTSPTQPTQS